MDTKGFVYRLRTVVVFETEGQGVESHLDAIT